MKEIWKIYKETNNFRWGHLKYEVSDQGNVKINGKLIDFSDYELRYYAVGSNNYVHRMVAELFVENPENKPEVDHINGNTHDNRAINLRWVTHLENMRNPITRSKKSGENNPMYGHKYTKEESEAQSKRMKKRFKDPNERLKCGRKGEKHHNYGKKLSKEQVDKQTNSIKKFYENSENRKKQSDLMKEYYKTHPTSISIGSKLMTDGVSKPIYVKPEHWGEFIDIGYRFGTNKKK